MSNPVQTQLLRIDEELHTDLKVGGKREDQLIAAMKARSITVPDFNRQMEALANTASICRGFARLEARAFRLGALVPGTVVTDPHEKERRK